MKDVFESLNIFKNINEFKSPKMIGFLTVHFLT